MQPQDPNPDHLSGPTPPPPDQPSYRASPAPPASPARKKHRLRNWGIGIARARAGKDGCSQEIADYVPALVGVDQVRSQAGTVVQDVNLCEAAAAN